MSTQTPIESNRRPAEQRAGSETDESRSRSRENALKHEQMGEGRIALRVISESKRTYQEDLERRIRPSTVRESFLVSQAALAMARLEHLPRVEEEAREYARYRAVSVWEDDRCAEVSKIASGLLKRPLPTLRRLLKTTQGAAWVLDRWRSLLTALEQTGRWTEEERQRAGSLLGIAPDEQPLDSRIRKDQDPERLKDLVRGEIKRLERSRVEALDDLNEREREMAIAGIRFDVSTEAWRFRRYEETCFKRMKWAEMELEAIEAQRLAAQRRGCNARADGPDSANSGGQNHRSDHVRSVDPSGHTPESAPAPSVAETPPTPAPTAPKPVPTPIEPAPTKRSQSTEDQFSKDLRAALERDRDPLEWIKDGLDIPPPGAAARQAMSRQAKRRAKREAARQAGRKRR